MFMCNVNRYEIKGRGRTVNENTVVQRSSNVESLMWRTRKDPLDSRDE